MPLTDRRDLSAQLVLLALSALAGIRLMALPAFEDEGTQLHFISRLISSAEWLQPLAYGKPLEVWPMAPWIGLGSSALASLRAIHVLAGALSALLLYRLGAKLGDRWAAFMGATLLALCPFEIYLQRLALSDILMSLAGIGVLLCTLRLIERQSSANAAWLAAALVLGALCKLPPGFIFLLWLPTAWLLMPSSLRTVLKRRENLRCLMLSQLPAALLASAVLLVNVLRFMRGEPLTLGVQDLITVGAQGPVDIAAVMGVMPPSVWDELRTQLTWPVLALASVGLLAAALGSDWRLRWLAAVGVLPLLIIGCGAHFFYSRYLLFSLPAAAMATVHGWRLLGSLMGRPALISTLLCLCCSLFMLPQSVRLIMEPDRARWSAVDRFQYIEGWPSGYGYPEAAAFIVAAEAPPSIIALEGHSAEQLLTYLPASWRSRVSALSDAQRSGSWRGLADGTWILISPQLLSAYWQDSGGEEHRGSTLHPVASFQKPGGRVQLAIYAVGR